MCLPCFYVTYCVLLSKICETYCVFAFKTLFFRVPMFLIVCLPCSSVTHCVLLCGRTGWTPDYGCGRPEKPRPARAAKKATDKMVSINKNLTHYFTNFILKKKLVNSEMRICSRGRQVVCINIFRVYLTKNTRGFRIVCL